MLNAAIISSMQKVIDELNLRNIVELENKIIWITANLELTGINIDVWNVGIPRKLNHN